MKKQKIVLSASKGSIVISEDEFENGLATGSTKRGILAVDPDFDPSDVLEYAKTKTWRLQEMDNSSSTGLYEVIEVKAQVENVSTEEIEQEA